MIESRTQRMSLLRGQVSDIPGMTAALDAKQNALRTVEVIADFGFPRGTFTRVPVAATWVNSSSRLNVILSGEATADHDPEDYVLEEISAMATNIQNGTGFDLLVRAPNGTHGQYKLFVQG